MTRLIASSPAPHFGMTEAGARDLLRGRMVPLHCKSMLLFEGHVKILDFGLAEQAPLGSTGTVPARGRNRAPLPKDPPSD